MQSVIGDVTHGVTTPVAVWRALWRHTDPAFPSPQLVA